MLPQLQDYLTSAWRHLPDAGARPKRFSFLGQATGVSKACFFVFGDDDPTPRYIVKIPRSPVYNDALAREVATIERLRGIVSDGLRATLPGPMHTTWLAGQYVVIEPLLAGRPLDSRTPPGRPLDPATTRTHLELAQRWLMRAQQEAAPRTGRLDARSIRHHFLEPLEAVRRSADLTANEASALDHLVREAGALDGQEMPFHLYHGDFRAGNILLDGDRLAVLDWEFSRPLAPPLLDWFSFVFRLYSRAIDLPDIDGPLERYRTAFREVFFAHNWFSELVAAYTRSACRVLGIDETHLPLLLGFFVVTNIHKFYSFLSQRSERGYLYLLQHASPPGQSFRQLLRRQAYVWLLGDLVAGDRSILDRRART